ncbi:MAG TPA: CHRD domain-containing protein, partial [Chitinophagaceae bacterium]|nr:CHRD domain-containing protein [Chitinophagaceae bacterium]
GKLKPFKKRLSLCQIQKRLIFTANHATMQLTKLTALSLLLFVFAINIVSCESDAELKKTQEYVKTGIPMTGAQENPANPSPAIGTMDVSYNTGTKVLSYKVTWQGLTDSVMLMHIHGLAPIGFNAGVVQNIVTPSNGIYPQKTSNKYNFLQQGTISNTLTVDGVKVKEIDLLNGFYYINIHTTNYPGGEIRGQIRFQ